MRLILIIFFGCISCFTSQANTSVFISKNEDIIGSWTRVKKDGDTITYNYDSNGHLTRFDEKGIKKALGNYIINDNVIYFLNNPENYTPVTFVIKMDVCNDIKGKTLFLFHKKSGIPYGCYSKAITE